ncbi:MAG: AAA family ATPase [Arenicella sp.]|nr:AAA family ATPase [Arenicella sp.]
MTSALPNITLIGMPGSGKSTLGRRLARQRGMSFVDTDHILEQVENMHIQNIVNRRGVKYLRFLEGMVLSRLELQNHVIATGGSAVYSRQAMDHLGAIGARVYLQISMRTLTQRVDNSSSRGLAKMKSHSLPRLYSDRVGLYESAADITVPNDRPMTALGMGALNNALDDFFNV